MCITYLVGIPARLQRIGLGHRKLESLQKRLGLDGGWGGEEATAKSIEDENQDLGCLVPTTWTGLHLNLGSMKAETFPC